MTLRSNALVRWVLRRQEDRTIARQKTILKAEEYVSRLRVAFADVGEVDAKALRIAGDVAFRDRHFGAAPQGVPNA